MEVFKLFGSIFIDSDEADKSIRKTDSLVEKLGKGLQNGVKTAAKWGAALGAAAVGAGAAMFGMAKKSADALDEIHKGSQRMGVSTKAYQEMEYWASQNGMSMNDMEKVAGRLNQRLGEAANGNEKYSNALEKMGVNMDNVRDGTLSTEDAFAQSIQSLSQMGNEQEKAALASELFGTKLAREMLPALNDSSLSFEDAQKKAQELGLVLSEDAVNSGATFTDTMDDIKRSLGSVVTNLGASVMPMFQTMLDWILEHMPQIQAVIKVVFEKIGEFVNVAIDIFKDHLLPIFKNIFDWTKENWPAIQKIIENVFKAIKFVWDNILKPTLNFLWDIIKGIVSWVSDNWGTISKVFETVFNVVKGVWDNILSPVLTALWDVLKGIFDFVTNVFAGVSKVFEGTFDAIGKSVKAVTKIFTGFIDGIKSAWEWLTKWNKTPVEKKETSVSQNAGYSQVKTHGSHAGGLDYVPFDGYVAELHKGERVLTADENRVTQGINNNFNISSLVVREEADVKKVAKELFDLQQRSNRGRGIVTI